MGKKKGRKKKVAPSNSKQRSSTRVNPAVIALLAIVVLAVVIVLLRGGGSKINNTQGESVEEQFTGTQGPVATIEMESGDLIKVGLDPINAPNTVRNFISLAEEGFYDGLIFHRVIPDFMIQGGCPEGTGRGGPGYFIKGEFAANGHENELLHKRGIISMARSQPFDSAGSQFFITVADSPHLDTQYAAFGTVLEGMGAVDRIVEMPRDAEDKPLEDQRIRRVTVEKFGVEYDPPEKV
jgi:peptidyl-prolyl cis-trans isomerase B (cyclophilin B)